MSDSIFDRPGCMIAIIIAMAVALLLLLGWADSKQSAEALIEGRAAFSDGISPESNPYQGSRSNTNQARAWLRGYIEAKNGAKQ